MTDEKERAQKDKEKEKKKRAKLKKAEQKQATEIERTEALATASALERKRIEEEERRRIDAGSCANCGLSLFEKTSYDVFDRRCCNSDCAAKFRRKTLAAAAEARLKG